MTIAAMPPEAAPARPIPTTRPGVPAPPVAVPETAATVSDTPRRTRADTTLRLVTSVALAGGAILAGIGFAGSYKALQALGEAKGLGRFSYVFPIGLDAGIVVLLALDLLLIRRRTPWPALRWLAHAFTAGTVVFNASSGWTHSRGPGGRCAPRRHPADVYCCRGGWPPPGHQADEAGGRPPEGTGSRCTAGSSPPPTAALWRRMKLWGISSYREAVDPGAGTHGLPGDAGARVRQRPRKPRRMPGCPLTHGPVRADRRRGPGAAPPSGGAGEGAGRPPSRPLRRPPGRRPEERRAQAQIAALRRQSAIQAAQAEAEAAARAAEAQAQAQVTAAERLAQLEEQAVETATIAEAKAKAAAAARREAEERRAQAAAEAEAAELERQAAQARAEAAEAEKAAEAEAQAFETQAAAEARRRAAEEEEAAAEIERRAAESPAGRRRNGGPFEARAAEEAERARLAAAEANRRAAEMEEAAAEARRRAAEIELRAVEMEDAAQLKPSERAARKVARMALAEAGGRAEALPLERIVEVLGVSTSTASERRREAAELLAAGYRPSVD
ncbi:DUF2637 domain-containing protein [Streptomyces thermogriseus]|uniref:DUF2637 domain-containing protein n=1 Tax=Streptomyces thermogriseus TaxID=75292 RepID=UPI003621A53D